MPATSAERKRKQRADPKKRALDTGRDVLRNRLRRYASDDKMAQTSVWHAIQKVPTRWLLVPAAPHAELLPYKIFGLAMRVERAAAAAPEYEQTIMRLMVQEHLGRIQYSGSLADTRLHFMAEHGEARSLDADPPATAVDVQGDPPLRQSSHPFLAVPIDPKRDGALNVEGREIEVPLGWCLAVGRDVRYAPTAKSGDWIMCAMTAPPPTVEEIPVSQATAVGLSAAAPVAATDASGLGARDALLGAATAAAAAVEAAVAAEASDALDGAKQDAALYPSSAAEQVSQQEV